MMLAQRISVLAHDFAKQCHVAPDRVEEEAARQRRTMTDNYTGTNDIVHVVCIHAYMTQWVVCGMYCECTVCIHTTSSLHYLGFDCFQNQTTVL